MSAKAFFDTNVLIYLYSCDEPEKRELAVQKTEAIENRWISTQVLSEISNTIFKKFKLDYSDIAKVLSEIQASFQIITVKPNTIGQALKLAQTYRYSYYDSLIIAAALEQSCPFLYSEDMQHQQFIDQRLTILNPFKS
ncbi:MAG: PIN domain-containing protein [Methylovulum sp.]|nr:PIN domain-containing protein [Methylovulum sp.]